MGNLNKVTYTDHQTVITADNLNAIQDSVIQNTSYTTCSTGASTAAKTATLANFVLTTGSAVKVKFTNTNTAANPTLNINSTGAKPIMQYGVTPAGITPPESWDDGAVVEFVYDGTNWVMQGRNTIDAVSKANGGIFNDNIRVTKENSDTSSTQSLIGVGNNIPEGTAGASYGGIQLFCDDSHYIFLRPAAGSFSANHSVIFQDSGGTVALTKDYLYSGTVELSAGKSYAVGMPANFKGFMFTIPLTSGIDAWGIYGLTTQGQASEAERLKYYKTLIGCSTISFSQSGGSTGTIIITNSGSYAVTALWVAFSKPTFTRQ